MSEESQEFDKQLRDSIDRIEELEDNYSKDSITYKEVMPKLKLEKEKIEKFESKKKAYLIGYKEGFEFGRSTSTKI